MTKASLVARVAEKANITRVKAETVVNIVFGSIAEALIRSDRIEIRGFGTFVIREYDDFMGRNPRTSVKIHVSKKRLPFFRTGKELREAINQKD